MDKSASIVSQSVKNRISLYDRVREALEQLPSGEGKSIFNFWGCPGEGRTTLLEHLRDILFKKVDSVTVAMWDADKIPVDELIVDIQTWLEIASHQLIKVILIDNLRALLVDGSDNPYFVEFEHNLVTELVNRNDVLMIIASQHEIRQWHELLVRMRQTSWLIPPMTREEFDEAAQARGIQPAKALELSLGHPAPLDWIYDKPGISIDEIDSRAIKYFLRGLEEDISEETRALSLLLQFDEIVMERALEAAGLGGEKTYFDLLDSIRKMGFAGMLLHDSRTGVYKFTDASVRRLLARGYRRENSQRIQRIHETIFAYYSEAARRASILQNNLCSAVFHLAWYAKLKGENVVASCIDWVNLMTPFWKDADWEQTWHVWLSGQGESTIVLELCELLGDDGYNKLSDMFKAEWRKYHEKTDTQSV